MTGPFQLPRVLVVDDEPAIREMLCMYLSGHGFAATPAGDADEALSLLGQSKFDLVVSDLNMPGRSGIDLLRDALARHPQLCFLIATASTDTPTAVEAMRTGAADFLLKPLRLDRVLAAARRALKRHGEQQERLRLQAEAEQRQQHAEQLLRERTAQLGSALELVRQASAETLQALAIALDIRAQDVAGHSDRVTRYTVELARRLGYDVAALARLERAAYLHDIGKLGVPDAILNKPGPLSAEEQEIMRSHVQLGHELVTKVPSLAHAADLVLAHQEHFDGGGYPHSLAGEAIPRDARIFAVADALDAMTSDRPYRKALPWSEARAEIERQSGRQFDPEVVAAFLAITEERWRELQTGAGTAAPRKTAEAS